MKRLLGLLTIAVVLISSSFAAADERPNVLWIYLEDVSGWFGCYGETLIETPNIDGLAEAGTRFDRFYTPAGVCSATRSAIVTGMLQTTIGAHHHRSCRATFRGQEMGEFDENELDINTIPEIMRAAGYYSRIHGGPQFPGGRLRAAHICDCGSRSM
jgi:arylsulfatase A-like enzyme